MQQTSESLTYEKERLLECKFSIRHCEHDIRDLKKHRQSIQEHVIEVKAKQKEEKQRLNVSKTQKMNATTRISELLQVNQWILEERHMLGVSDANHDLKRH